jgi:hypothetical protein
MAVRSVGLATATNTAVIFYLSYAHDLKSKIPYHSLSTEDKEKYWDDGLHLTMDGYQWMGGFIADELIRLIREESNTAMNASVLGGRLRRREWYDGDFEEEQGSPGVLSQGYVVVRKKDLV